MIRWFFPTSSPLNCDTNSPVSTNPSAPLVRAIGRWSFAALVVNSIIGSGVFGLPSQVAGLVGAPSPLAVLIAGAAIGVIIACYAEVASYFSQSGGPYLYARATFGRLLGIEVGWMLWLVRLTAPAANANLFVIYLGEFWPAATQPLPRLIILTLLIGLLAAVNYRGVRLGAQVSSFFTAAKLLPLLIVILAGVAYAATGHRTVSALPAHVGLNLWLQAILLLIFAYGGFEGSLIVMAEAKNPRRDAAFGLFVALITCIVVYTLIQWVVVHLLPDAAHSARPLADAARLTMGRAGAILISLGALLSTYGYLSANMLTVPRITYALAEQRDFPAIFAAVHTRFQTPYFSILAFAVLAWAFALMGSFTWNVTLSAVARLFVYAVSCAALPVLRKRRPGQAWFRLPAGKFFTVIALLICVVLCSRIDLSGSLILIATLAIAFVNWLWVRRRPEPQTAAGQAIS